MIVSFGGHTGKLGHDIGENREGFRVWIHCREEMLVV